MKNKLASERPSELIHEVDEKGYVHRKKINLIRRLANKMDSYRLKQGVIGLLGQKVAIGLTVYQLFMNYWVLKKCLALIWLAKANIKKI